MKQQTTRRKKTLQQKKDGATRSLVRGLATKGSEKYVLKLFIVGSTPRSQRAVANIKKLCEEYLPGRYELQVIDAYQQPELLRGKQIIAAPTLVKELPLPLRKFIGDLSDKPHLIMGLELMKED